MSMPDRYSTCLGPGEYVLVEKKSKFIANVAPVSTEEEARTFLDNIRKTYPDARHVVYAYLISGDSTYQRYSDDGEPQGTGGLPVLEAIKREGLTNVVCTVTRYFGGILLGAPGLTRAYGTSASGALQAAGRREVVKVRVVNVIVSLSAVKTLNRALPERNYTILGVDYMADATFKVACTEERIPELCDLINDLTAGVNLVEPGDEVWM
ncbi:MAG: YigZ family protein [Clostridia bacterium]|nr:YigZ family protein [Clostridia bacterium]